MNVWSTRTNRINSGSGVLFKRTTPKAQPAVTQPQEVEQADSRGKYPLAFAGLYLFTLLMYLRPQEVFPGLFGEVPVVKIVTIGAILVYLVSKLSAGERLITWPLEMKMVSVMFVMGLLLMPVAVSPQDSYEMLTDTFLKTVLVFILLINLVDTRARLRLLLHTMVFCELLFALGGIKTFLAGGYDESKSFLDRMRGWGTMFANPNDFASLLDVMLPFVLIFALTRRGWTRPFYFACAGLAALAVTFTFSRSGFIGLVAAVSAIIWKLSRGRRLKVLLPAVTIVVVMFMAMPGKYAVRLSTIFNPETDTTNSAQGRQEMMNRAAELAVKRSVVGIGMGNFHIYSVGSMVAHNSYLETGAELGIVGLIAYLIVILAPIRSLRRIERETRPDGAWPEREMYIISVCLQASLAAYIVYGFFGSVQYFNFLYFTVAYAVALRRIHSAEIREAADASDGAEAPESHAKARPARGKLWSPRRFCQRWLTRGSRSLVIRRSDGDT